MADELDRVRAALSAMTLVEVCAVEANVRAGPRTALLQFIESLCRVEIARRAGGDAAPAALRPMQDPVEMNGAFLALANLLKAFRDAPRAVALFTAIADLLRGPVSKI